MATKTRPTTEPSAVTLSDGNAQNAAQEAMQVVISQIKHWLPATNKAIAKRARLIVKAHGAFAEYYGTYTDVRVTLVPMTPLRALALITVDELGNAMEDVDLFTAPSVLKTIRGMVDFYGSKFASGTIRSIGGEQYSFNRFVEQIALPLIGLRDTSAAAQKAARATLAKF